MSLRRLEVNDQDPIFDTRCYLERQEKVGSEKSHLLFETLTNNTIDKLKDINRAFSKIAIIGPYTASLITFIKAQYECKIDLFSSIDLNHIPLKVNHYDLILVDHFFHRVNALPELMLIIHHALVPDGLFLGTTYGSETLRELKESFLACEIEQGLSVKPHISPFLDLESAGALLQKTGFQLPVVDSDKRTLLYESLEDLFVDLKILGETNYLTAQHRGLMRKKIFKALSAYYHKHYKEKSNKVFATIEVLNLLGWKKHESQQQPLRRGSGQIDLESIF